MTLLTLLQNAPEPITVEAVRAVGSGFASAPTVYGVAVVATPVPDGTPSPFMDVAFTGLSGDTMSVYRSTEGKRTLVRGYKRQAIVGSTFALSDFEAPFGANVTYDVEVYNTAGVLTAQGVSDAVVLDVQAAWVADALNPSVCTSVRLHRSSLAQGAYSRDGGPVNLAAASTPVGVLGVRRVGQGIPLVFNCRTEAVFDTVLGVLNSADPLVVRTPPGYRLLPRLAYVTCAQWQPQIMSGMFAQIVGSVDIIAAPSASVIVPTRTYGTVAGDYSSYGNLLASVSPSTYLKLLRG